MTSLARQLASVGPNGDSSFIGGIVSLLCPIGSGALLALSFSPGYLQFLSWIALVPLGLVLRARRNGAELCFGLYLGGLVFHLIHLDWIRSGKGDTGFAGPHATQWLAQGMMLAVMWPIILFIGRLFASRVRIPMALALPIVWVAFEFTRKQLWVIFDATGYPYGQLGLTQTDNSRMMQIADVGGVYAVGACVAAVNGLIVDIFFWVDQRRRGMRPKASFATIAVPCVFIGLALLYGQWRLSQEIVRNGPVICLMPYEDTFADGDEGMKAICESISIAGGRSVDHTLAAPELLIWSEGAYPKELQFSPSSPAIGQLERFARLADAATVVGCDRLAADGETGRFNSAAVIDAKRGYLGCYDKLRLVPYSEFYPVGRPTFGPVGMDRFKHGVTHKVFDIEADQRTRGYSFAIAICYDTAFPEVFREYMRPPKESHAPDFFVVPAAERHDRQMRLQNTLLQLARFRAIECRRAFVRNAEGGYSGIIDGNGTLIEQPPKLDFHSPVNLGRMPMDQRFSLYTILGDWLPWGAITIIAITLVSPQLRRSKLRNTSATAQNGSSNVP